MSINGVRPAQGKLGVLLPGMGAVATTFIAGVEAVRRGIGQPIGSLTQLAHVRLGKRTEDRNPLIRDFVPLADLNDIVFGGWDPIPEDAYQSALTAGVLDRHEHIEPIADFLKAIKPMPAVFDSKYVTRLDGTNVKTGTTKRDLGEQLRQDIRDFKARHGCDRLVMVWCASTEVFLQVSEAHMSLEKFEQAMDANEPAIAPSMIYAWAALHGRRAVRERCAEPDGGFACASRSSPGATVASPVSGKDFKSGQTMMKTILAPGLKARMLGLSGWFSTNILGNRDGAVLDDPDSFKTKEESKLGVHRTHPAAGAFYPELYGNVYHKVRIEYYPPRGDNKEGWDNLDIFGWLGYPMQIKVDFPVPRFDPGGAHRAGPRAVHGPGPARGDVRHPGVALVLLQEPDDGAGAVSGARPVHPAHGS
jgi:myo-inositol-1-phosphate synthase